MTTPATLQAARQRVAEAKPGCARVILAGGWDQGDLVKQAEREVERDAR